MLDFGGGLCYTALSADREFPETASESGREIHPFDLLVGFLGAAALKAVIYFKGKNAKKYRQGEEYGSARWSA